MPDEKQMSVKRLLQSLRSLQTRIEVDLNRLNQMREQAAGGGGLDYSKQSIHGGTPQTMGDKVVYIVDFESRIKRDIARRNALLTQAMDIIDSVQEERLQLILILRYREFLSWDEIADKMGYECRQVYRLHRIALRVAKQNQLKMRKIHAVNACNH